jgi:hypothetical protein
MLCKTSPHAWAARRVLYMKEKAACGKQKLPVAHPCLHSGNGLSHVLTIRKAGLAADQFLFTVRR